MSEIENKELLSRYIGEVWDNANVEAIRDYVAPSYRRHTSPALEPLDVDSQVKRISGFRSAFPDVTLVVEDVVAEGNRVAFRSTMRGSHLGEFIGIEPTGKTFVVGLVDVLVIEDGLITEQWGGPNTFDLLRQLGADVSISGSGD